MAPPGGKGSGAVRRMVLAGGAYAVLAFVVGLPLAGHMRRVFLLPPMFDPMVRGLLVAVGVVVLLVAWRYPEMEVGGADSPDRRSGRGPR